MVRVVWREETVLPGACLQGFYDELNTMQLTRVRRMFSRSFSISEGLHPAFNSAGSDPLQLRMRDKLGGYKYRRQVCDYLDLIL